MDSKVIVEKAFTLNWCLENCVLPSYSSSKKLVVVALSEEKHVKVIGNFITKKIKNSFDLDTKFEVRSRSFILDQLSSMSKETNDEAANSYNQKTTQESEINQDSQLIQGPLFTQAELAKMYSMPLQKKKSELRKQFYIRIKKPPYSTMNDIQKLEYCKTQITAINKENSLGCWIVGFTLLICMSFILAPMGDSVLVSMISLLGLISILCFSDYIHSHYISRNKLLVPLFRNEVSRYAGQESQLREANEKKREAVVRQSASKSQEIFEEMLQGKSDIKTVFSEYKDSIQQEIMIASPNPEDIKQAAAARDLGNAVALSFFGVIGDEYTPSEDSRYSKQISILDRERDRIKQLAHEGYRLPFVAIEYFQEVSRAYFGMHRPGGNAAIYDETLIQNEVSAMKESISIQGDYVDNRVKIDRSVKRTTQNITNIENVTLESGEFTSERITKEILKLILSSKDESASRVEIMSVLPVEESQILGALEQMQLKGQLRISNRETGEIVYKLDRLA